MKLGSERSRGEKTPKEFSPPQTQELLLDFSVRQPQDAATSDFESEDHGSDRSDGIIVNVPQKGVTDRKRKLEKF